MTELQGGELSKNSPLIGAADVTVSNRLNKSSDRSRRLVAAMWGKRFLLVAAATTAIVLSGCGNAEKSTANPIPTAQAIGGSSLENVELPIELNYLKDWYSLPLDQAGKKALSLIGREVIFNIDTPDLRLNIGNGGGLKFVLMSPWISPDKELFSQAGPDFNSDRDLIYLRLTKEQYTDLKKKWGTVSKNDTENIHVPEGVKLRVKPERLYRGDYGGDISTQFVFQGFIPASSK